MKKYLTLLMICGSLLINCLVYSQELITPKEHFGFDIGDDYQLANYTQIEAYFKKLAGVSDRVLMKEIGETEEGRNQYILIVSSPNNLKNIDRYKEISQRLARAEDLSKDESNALIKEGKPVVWIDGGLHSNEMVGSHQLIELYYRLLSQEDPETLRILEDVIILLSHVNPDGQELVANWYMQEKDPLKRNMQIPRLYQKYVGHDNNRDFFMMNMNETTNISRQQYIEWMPQIIYNHHQPAPAGAVVAGPPYRDPFNYVFDPLLITGIDGVGAAMINRLNVEGKPGYTRLSGSVYSTWWNGGLRTTPYFHNMIGILTEMTGSPSPTRIPFIPERLIPNNSTPNPVRPQAWSFKKSIDYSISLNYAILDYASRFGDQLLMNIYTMGKNSIEKGNQDHWTLQPNRLEEIRKTYEKDKKDGVVKASGSSIPTSYYDTVFNNPALRDARAYIISKNQADFPTAVKFINALIKSGIFVHKAKSKFIVDGKSYPAGSYIVKTNQAFRPHVLDMFEAQYHPNDFQYPGGPPIRPYDAAGWTLAYQMGVEFERILDELNGPFGRIEYGEIQKSSFPTIGKSTFGYLLDIKVNNSFIVVNKLLKAGVPVYRITKPHGEATEGSFYVPLQGFKALQLIVNEVDVGVQELSSKPKHLVKINSSKIALFDRYGGSMPSGWTRWLLEEFDFSFKVIYPQDIDKGNLIAEYDVILFMDGGIPTLGQRSSAGTMPKLEDVPKEYRSWLGSITVDKSIPQLKEFMERGGEIVTVGSSTNLAYHLGLPVQNALLIKDPKGQDKALSTSEYYIPGSVLTAKLDQSQLANWGMPSETSLIFNNSPVFRISLDETKRNIKPLAWFDVEKDALRSGWAWGQDHLKGSVASFVAPVGKGKLYAFGPEITFRGQSHATFKMLFNTLYLMK